MNDFELMKDIKELFHTYKLGNILEEPISIKGGLLHRMYKVITDSHTYALKWLNPSIIQRNGVTENMLHSEQIASAFSGYLPIVAALQFDGNPLLYLNGKYFMVFHWLEGVSIFPPDITKAHCHAIGSTLGKIHQLNLSVPTITKEKSHPSIYNWQQYYILGQEQKASWINLYAQVLDRLILWNNRAYDAKLRSSENMVLSHRDLDPKNVMWKHDTPYIIDWEAAGYINPYQELLEVLNYWADSGNGELNEQNFNSLLHAYRKYMRIDNVDWDCILDSGFDGMLNWLEYSLKRALGIESSDEEEIKLGAEQIQGTITALEKYTEQLITIRKWLSI